MNTGAAHEEIQQQHHHQSPTALAPSPTPATDAPAGVGSPTPAAPATAPDRKAWAVSLLTALREARPTSEYYRTGYRHAVSVICAHIEQSEYFLGGETAPDLAATRQAFNIRA